MPPPHPTTLGTLTALTHLYYNFGLPALLGLAALCGGLTDAILLYGALGWTKVYLYPICIESRCQDSQMGMPMSVCQLICFKISNTEYEGCMNSKCC